MTFTLTGFKTVKREGINLPTSFTATINADLSIGALAESVTVTGESPLVDVRSSVSQSVMNRERLDTIPTGKDPFAVGQLIAGVTTSTPDVGGTQVMQQPTLQVHGSSNNDNVFMVDGVQIQHIGFGGNQTGFYFNDGLMEEISYQTSSLPAEAPVGGVQINMIPHDGGNTFHGGVFSTGANSSMQSNNLSQDLIDLNFKVQNRVQSVYDVNLTLGGPVRKDHLWFFGTVRRWSANNYLGNTFTSTGDQAVDDQRLTDAHHPSHVPGHKNNKLSFHYDRSIKWRGHRPNNWLSASINDPISDVVQTTQLNYIGEIKWASTISNQLLAEASMFTLPVNYTLGFEPDAARTSSRRSIRRNRSSAAYRRAWTPTARGCSPTPRTCRMSPASTASSRHAGAHRLVAGAVHDARRHAADHEQRRPNSVRLVNTPSGHKENGRERRHLRAGFLAYRPVDAEPGHPVRALRDVDSGAERSRRHVGWRARLPGAGRHHQLEYRVAAPRLRVGRDWRRPDGLKGGVSRYDRLEGVTIIQPLEPAQHLIRDVSLGRLRTTTSRLRPARSTWRNAAARCSRRSATSIRT